VRACVRVCAQHGPHRLGAPGVHAVRRQRGAGALRGRQDGRGRGPRGGVSARGRGHRVRSIPQRCVRAAPVSCCCAWAGACLGAPGAVRKSFFCDSVGVREGLGVGAHTCLRACPGRRVRPRHAPCMQQGCAASSRAACCCCVIAGACATGAFG